MHSANRQFDPEDRPNSINQAGVDTPVKSASSASDVPFDPEATLIAFPEPSSDPDATIVDGATQVDLTPPPRNTVARKPSRAPVSAGVLQDGDVLGGRYEILQELGEGGMGAVYKALDRELDRPVALKLIRRELASNPSILARFKQELLLARQVTHRNVIRIFDLGDADGVKFITMEFVEGQDLRTLIKEKKKLSPQEAVEIIQQACRALEAAHNVGVIHRDLKPQNIMQENTGRVIVMDFGLARTLEGDGMTQTGALVGTMEYMSPEQALAKDVDQRSDIFSMGLILYELLAGVTPFKAESAVASLLKRTSERAIPVSDHDETIPRAVSNIVSKCLERDSNQRYQSTSELLRDLEAWQGKSAAATLGFQPAVEPWGRTLHWPLLSGVAAIVLLVIAAYVFRGPLFSSMPKKTASAPAISLAILPFRNASGDPTMDWLGSSLADMLSTDVGQSERLHAVSQDRVHQLFSDLHIPPTSALEPTTLRRVAEFTNADTLVSGQYAKFGGQIRIDATLQDLKHDRSIPIKLEGVDEKDIPGAVDRLAATIRQNLAFSSDAVQELKASSFQPSSRSPVALRDYSQGIQLLREGKTLDAVKAFDSATKDDPEFALAYSHLADADSDLGYDSDAENASRKAVELSQQLPSAEKYLIQATQARITKDNKRAIETYENLARNMPDNSDVESALAGLYTETGNYDAARGQLSKLLASDPRNIKALWQMGLVECYQGNPQNALDPLNKGLSLAVEEDNPQQKALILQGLGISYRLMNKPDEAIKSIQDSMEVARKLGMKRLLAASLSELAQNQITIGKPDAATASYNQSLEILREIGDKKEYGDNLINRGVLYNTRGELDKALQDFKDALQIERDTADVDSQALCLSNIGDVYFLKYDTDNALIYYQQSLQLRQKLNQPVYLAETLSSLGELYTAMGDYDQALSNLMNALDIARKANDTKDSAEASESVGKVLTYEGRLGAAVSAMQDSVNGFRSTKNESAELAESLNDLADTLALAGRGNEFAKLLDEAAKIASDLKNESIHSELVNTRGDVAFFGGDYKAAQSAYEEAAQAAAKAKDREKMLIPKMNLARVSIAEGRDRAAIPELRTAIQQADTLHLKYYRLRGSVDLAEAMIKTKDYAHARQELDQDLNTSEKLGTRLLTATIHFDMGTLLKQTGDASGAAGQYRQAAGLLEEISKEPGAERFLDRPDIKVIYKESANSVQ